MTAMRLNEMDVAQFRTAVREIVTTSTSEAEIRRRLNEGGCNGDAAAILVRAADSPSAAKAATLGAALGGLLLPTGEMVMIMLYHPRTGDTVQL
jgi:hypothetical protein